MFVFVDFKFFNCYHLMVMKWYVLVTFLISVLSIVGFLIILLNLNPYETNSQIKSLFFVSLFLAFLGLSTSLHNGFKLKTDWPDFYRSFKIGFIVSLVLSSGILITRYVIY